MLQKAIPPHRQLCIYLHWRGATRSAFLQPQPLLSVCHEKPRRPLGLLREAEQTRFLVAHATLAVSQKGFGVELPVLSLELFVLVNDFIS